MNHSIAPPTRPPVSDALVSVVLPVFNESRVLAEMCRRLRAALSACRTTFEIIFVNDGSRDGGAAQLDRLAQQFPDVRVVHLSRNFGHQAAIHAGLNHARGDAIVLMDSDLQDPPEAIAKLLEAWQSGYDVAYAVRVRRKEWFGRRLLFAGFHRLLSSIAQTPIPVDAGNFGLLDARVARAVVAMGERDRYLPGLRSWVGFRQIGIPVERGARYDNHPRVSLGGLLRLAKTAVFSFSALPLAAFAWIGWTALAVFLTVAGTSLYFRLFTELAVPGWTSQLVTMSFFAALNALGISMLGEYVVRIYDQVRSRPLYLVDRTVNFVDKVDHTIPAPGIATAEPGACGFDLEHLDPLELDTRWDDAYQHLLDQANDLMELGALARAEEADMSERSNLADESGSFDPLGGNDQDGEQDESPRVLQLPQRRS